MSTKDIILRLVWSCAISSWGVLAASIVKELRK